jgi:LuxR family maltose regulon positive regulatory protein
LTNETSLDELESSPLPLIRALEYTTLAQVYIARDQPNEALQVIERILQAMDDAGWTVFVLQNLVFQALALQARGDTPQAMATLERALSLGEPGGFIRVFIDEGEPLAALLRQAAPRGITPYYVAKLLAAFEDETKAPYGRPPSHEAGEVAGLIEPLSERELEVLRLIAAGLSNCEIADQLVVAISTVKTHINHIYRKLDVSKRTQAVARARELNLLY